MKAKLIELSAKFLLKLALLTAVVVSVLGVQYLQASFNLPGANPPAGNVPAPIVTSNVDQAASTTLGLGGLGITNNLLVTGSTTVGDTMLPNGYITLAVNGAIGASEYCDENGGNCMSASNLGSGPTFGNIKSYVEFGNDLGYEYAPGSDKKVCSCKSASHVVSACAGEANSDNHILPLLDPNDNETPIGCYTQSNEPANNTVACICLYE